MYRRANLVAILATVLMMSCTGRLTDELSEERDPKNDDGGGGSHGSGGVGLSDSDTHAAFTCDAKAPPAPDAALKRLSTAQYRNMVSDLVQKFWKSHAKATLDTLAPLLSKVPDDSRPQAPDSTLAHTTKRLDQVIDDIRVSAYFDVARAMGESFSSAPVLSGVVGSCASDADKTNDRGCAMSFIGSFGSRALKRPLTKTETEYFLSFVDASPVLSSGLANAVLAIMFAPEVTSHVEVGVPNEGALANGYRLSAYELASKLSFHFWQTIPDDELWDDAASGKLLEAQTYEEQVSRLARSPRAFTAYGEFFSDYLQLEELRPFVDKDKDPVYKTYAGSDLPGPAFRENAINEALDLVKYVAAQPEAKFSDVFTLRKSFARTNDLAKIYEVPVWDGVAAPPILPDSRPGILGRVAFLASGSSNTNPIMKGVRIRKSILCDELSAPPPDVIVEPIPSDPNKTARDMADARTASPTCRGCHTLINPLGFASESFDGLGRYRTEEQLFTKDGRPNAKVPVDARVAPQIVPGDEATVEGLPGLTEAIVNSGKAEACFARHYLRFAYSRWEDTTADGCALETVRKAAVEDGLHGALKSIALREAFRGRIPNVK